MKIQHFLKKVTILQRRFFNQAGIRKKRKVFVVGFNKSASTSLHYLFISLGLPSYHGVVWRTHDNPKFLQKYDCFSDGTPRDLAELDRLYAGSKFILNVRGLEGWVYSRLAHIEREKKSNQNFKANPGWDVTEEAIKKWIKQRNAYHLFVLSYFSNRPADILVVNFLRDELAATKICKFLGYKGEYQRPQKNVNPNKKPPKVHTEMLHHCITELGISKQELGYDIHCPSLENKEKQFQVPPDSSML